MIRWNQLDIIHFCVSSSIIPCVSLWSVIQFGSFYIKPVQNNATFVEVRDLWRCIFFFNKMRFKQPPITLHATEFCSPSHRRGSLGSLARLGVGARCRTEWSQYPWDGSGAVWAEWWLKVGTLAVRSLTAEAGHIAKLLIHKLQINFWIHHMLSYCSHW